MGRGARICDEGSKRDVVLLKPVLAELYGFVLLERLGWKNGEILPRRHGASSFFGNYFDCHNVQFHCGVEGLFKTKKRDPEQVSGGVERLSRDQGSGRMSLNVGGWGVCCFRNIV